MPVLRLRYSTSAVVIRSCHFIFSRGPCALEFCADLGGRIALHTGDARATAFLKQRLDMAIQRGNAAAVVGTLAEGYALQV